MFIVLLKFAENKTAASDHMQGHNSWLKQGFDDDVFLLAGSIEPGKGGTVIAHKESLEELQTRVNSDPFVAENVVRAEIVEISPKQVSKQLEFLMA